MNTLRDLPKVIQPASSRAFKPPNPRGCKRYKRKAEAWTTVWQGSDGAFQRKPLSRDSEDEESARRARWGRTLQVEGTEKARKGVLKGWEWWVGRQRRKWDWREKGPRPPAKDADYSWPITASLRSLNSEAPLRSRASPVAQSACNVGNLGSIPRLRRSSVGGNGNHPSILAWRISWTEEPRGLQSMGVSESRALLSTHVHTSSSKERGFPDGPVVNIPCFQQGTWVWSLVGEHALGCSKKKKK